jgi:hypothetical protein
MSGTFVLWNLSAIRAAVMPIGAYLEGQKFDGETTRLMGIAFEMALGTFGATLRPDDPIRAALAHKIIAQAQAGERDPERLCDAALKAVRPPDPLAGLPLAPLGKTRIGHPQLLVDIGSALDPPRLSD